MDRSFLVAAIIAVALAGCLSSPGQQFIELDPGTSGCSGDAQPASDADVCTKSLTVVDVNVFNNNAENGGGCWADTDIEQGDTGTLTYACAGGYARAVFGDGRTMEGLVDTDGEVQLCGDTAYEDTATGCDWGSSQSLTGSLTAGTLNYQYNETPTSGDSCGVSCPATGVVSIE